MRQSNLVLALAIPALIGIGVAGGRYIGRTEGREEMKQAIIHKLDFRSSNEESAVKRALEQGVKPEYTSQYWQRYHALRDFATYLEFAPSQEIINQSRK